MAVRSSRCGLPARTHPSGTVTHPLGTITPRRVRRRQRSWTERQNISTTGRRSYSRKVAPVSGRRACRGPTSVRRREKPVATSAWRRRMGLRFDHSSGPAAADLVAVGSAAAGLDDGEHLAVRQLFLTKQGSPEPGYQPKRTLPLAGGLDSCSGLPNLRRDYILVTEAIYPNCKL